MTIDLGKHAEAVRKIIGQFRRSEITDVDAERAVDDAMIEAMEVTQEAAALTLYNETALMWAVQAIRALDVHTILKGKTDAI